MFVNYLTWLIKVKIKSMSFNCLFVTDGAILPYSAKFLGGNILGSSLQKASIHLINQLAQGKSLLFFLLWNFT